MSNEDTSACGHFAEHADCENCQEQASIRKELTDILMCREEIQTKADDIFERMYDEDMARAKQKRFEKEIETGRSEYGYEDEDYSDCYAQE